MIRRVDLFDFNFYAADSLDLIAEDVLKKSGSEDGKLPLMVTPNVDQLVNLERKEHAELRKMLENAQWILPDGQPLVTMSKIVYGREHGIPIRLTGSDFFPIIWKMLRDREEPVAIVLPKAELGRRLQAENPNTTFYAPPYFKLEDRKTFEEVVEAAAALFAEKPVSYLFIGLGFPKQEHLALRLFEVLGERGIPLPKTFLLGASFEFYLGTKKRAPMIYQRMGIEFVHRVISEPRRMVKRYLIDDLAFIPIAYRELRKKR